MSNEREYFLIVYVEEPIGRAKGFFNRIKRIILDRATSSRIGVRFSKPIDECRILELKEKINAIIRNWKGFNGQSYYEGVKKGLQFAFNEITYEELGIQERPNT